MSQHRKSQVRSKLARYLHVVPDRSFDRAELQRDLGLEPLDVVLFVVSFEESEDVAFQIEELENVASELINVVSHWLEQHDREERLAAEDDDLDDKHITAA
jgi:hypothetical protein